jgi:MtfA peptidase
MLARLRRWRENRHIARLPVSHAQWEAAVSDWPVAARYRGEARDRLRDMSLRFLLRKRFESGGGLVVDDRMQLRIATMAAVPILELGLDWYEGWHSVILYPAEFVPDQEYEDEFGVVHHDRHPLSGEAWQQGPVILSWEDVRAGTQEPGYNVVIHEMAHKLDMRADGPNGSPPLHRGMDPAEWRRVFTAAWEDMAQQVEVTADESALPMDPYALESPGEFFSVASETFFETPSRLAEAWPDLYRQLALFYRQDPLATPGAKAF